MHTWGDKDVDWPGITKAACEIGSFLRRWGRVDVRQWKEKWGTVRVYCSFGWHQLHSITHPGYSFSQYPQWLWRLDCRVFSRFVYLLNWFVVPWHAWLYRVAYARAVRRRPHLRREILCCADWPELLKGL